MYLNKVTILGNLTRNPELKALPSGMKVASFSLATNRVWKDKDGKKQESAEFHNITVFGKSAELCAQYLKTGQSACVEGRLQTRSWDTPEGKKYRTEIVAEMVHFGPARQEGEDAKKKPGQKTSAAPSKETVAVAPKVEYPTEEINPEEIPF